MLWTLGLLAVVIGPMGPDAPAHSPQLAAHGSMVALAFGAGHAVYFSRSTDSGRTFSAPVRVGGGEIVPLTRHRGPRIAFAGSAIVITAVAGKTAAAGEHAHGLPADGDLFAWRSTDGGKTWSGAVVVNDSPGAASEGLHGLASDGGKRLFAAWLDKRASGTRLYGSASNDAGRTWSNNVLVYESPDSTICQCCHPSVAFDQDGRIVVMWRNWLNGSRDLYLARSDDGRHFSAAGKLGEGTWKLNACPMDGGGLAVTDSGVVTAWRRDHTLFLDRPGAPETAIGEGTDIAIAPSGNGVYTIWTTPAGIVVRAPDAEPHPLGAVGRFPSITTIPGQGALAAWESDGSITIELVR